MSYPAQPSSTRLPPVRLLMDEVDRRHGKSPNTRFNEYLRSREWFHAHMQKNIIDKYRNYQRPQTSTMQ